MAREHEGREVPVDEELDIDFEPEEELGSLSALKQKLARVKDELEEVKRERAEYLDGWQRCKADTVNLRRDTQQTIETARLRAQENLAEEIIPVVDSFDMAMQGEAWQNVDKTWRVGVESICAQLIRALEAGGVRCFGAEGEVFDHEKHHAVGETDESGEPDTIARVVRRGWMLNSRIIRPAEVIVGK